MMLRTNALLLFIGDLAVFIGGLFVALMIRYQELPGQGIVLEHIEAFLGVFVLWVIVFLGAGLYDTKVNLSRKLIPGIVMRAQIVNLALAGAYFFILPVGITPKTTLAIYLIVTTLAIVFWRLFVFPSLATKRAERALIVGTGDEPLALARILNEGRFFKFVVAEVVDPATFGDAASFRLALEKYIHEHTVTMVIGDMHSNRSQMLIPIFYDLAFYDERVSFLSLHSLYEQIFHRIPPSLVKESWILENVSMVPHATYDVLKRAFDLVGAIIFGAFTLLFYPFVWLAIKVEDGGSLFYTTERVGQYGRVIRVIKFRTMNGQDRGQEALRSSLAVTKVGRFLRKTRIDEFPQVWNVLRGDLSFIGPRPEMPALSQVYAEQIPYYTMRHLIKPGLSGWAQINDFDVPRSGIDVERTIAKLSFDLYYLKHRSFFLDLEIVVKTLKALLMRSGT